MLSQERLKLMELLMKERSGKPASAPATIHRISAVGAPIPLSFSQERLWFLQRLMPESVAFNIFKAVRLKGYLQIEVLEKTLTEIHRRHDSLRTTFTVLNEQPQQIIHPLAPFHLALESLESLLPAEKENAVHRMAEAERETVFDLETELLRCRLLRLNQDDHVMLVNMHHIVSDGWSIGLLLKELILIYEAFCQGKPSPLPEPRIQYADYALWQRQQMQLEKWQQQLTYWKRKLEAAPSTIELIPDHKREARQSFCGALESLVLPNSLREKLALVGRRHETTLFMTLLAGFYALLFRYTRGEDFTVGTPIANRRYRETEDLIGVFINTLVLRADCSGAPIFLELLERTRRTCIEAYANQDIPFEKVVEELNPRRALNEQPLFQIMFLLRNEPYEAPRCSSLAVSFLPSPNRTVLFDLSLSVHDIDGKLSFWMEYSSDVFEPSTIRRMLRHFSNLLAGLVEEPEKPVAAVSYLSASERQQLVSDWNNTKRKYAGARKNLLALLAIAAEENAGSAAVLHEDKELTYAELNRRANQLAHYLRKCGVRPETRVGIALRRTPELIVGLIGILKAGGAYVPLDPAYPLARLQYMVKDAGLFLLVTENGLREKFAPIDGTETLCVDEASLKISREPSGELCDNAIEERNLAYLIYTSGSGGVPKAVAITFGNALALVRWAHEVFSKEELSGVLAATSICFDLSVFEIFVPLTAGGTVVLAENALQLPALRQRNRVRLLNTVPSAAVELVRQNAIPEQVLTINLAGEALTADLVDELYGHCAVQRILDLYGPSETTTYSTYHIRRKNGPETIGRPISNTEIYILDEHMEPVPIGVLGEIYIGGEGTSRGYWGQPALTAARYVPHPFSRSARGGDRLYQTGDLGRFREDGAIEYRGRADTQVKIRGYRVELAEVEAALRAHPSVMDAVVIAKVAPDRNQRLVAYVVARNGVEGDAHELREHVRQKLPEYMVPTMIVQVPAFPLTPSGKVNRKALPDPEESTPVCLAGPRTELEEAVAEIWMEVLGLKQVDVMDHFFELGGHSLLATRMLSRICVRFQLNLPLRAVFQFPTISGLAALIAQIRAENQPASPGRPGPTSRAGQELNALLDEISQLSEEEAQSLLAKEGI
jgi:amino acid adenylation domain-containing protein